jgi:tetratricopeptide (TPR) repeat protein
MMNRTKCLALSLTAAVLAASCASSGQSLSDYKAKKAKLLTQDNVITGVAANKLGKETEFIIAQEMSFSLNINTARSHNAKRCENFARDLPAKAEGVTACQLALSDPSLSVQNRKASLFNQALILSNLSRNLESKALLRQLIQRYPNMAEPHYELARQSHNQDDYDMAITHAKAALRRGLERSDRAYNLIGIAHEHEFDFSKARAAYEAALSRNPAAGDTRRRLERLNRLWPAAQ